jgi:hypothetical protein
MRPKLKLPPKGSGILVGEDGKWQLPARLLTPPIHGVSGFPERLHTIMRGPVISRAVHAAPPAEIGSNLSRPPAPGALPRVLSRDQAQRELAKQFADR